MLFAALIIMFHFFWTNFLVHLLKLEVFIYLTKIYLILIRLLHSVMENYLQAKKWLKNRKTEINTLNLYTFLCT